MRAISIFGCSALLTGAVLGCGSSSGSGGAGGTGSTTASVSTTASSTKSASATSSTKASTSSSGSGTGGAGGAAFINCNPVHDTECDVAGGDDCDFDGNGGFVCYAGPSTLDLCATCDVSGAAPPYCKDGSTCYPIDAAGMNGKCVKFCCSDNDCGGGAASCNKAATGDPNVGLCGTPDATNMFIANPLCSPTVPATPPSGGTCYHTPP